MYTNFINDEPLLIQAECLTSHPALDSLRIPFNRVEISPQISLHLPCHLYKIEYEERGAAMVCRSDKGYFTLPIVVLCSLPFEIRQCFDTGRIVMLMVKHVNQRFKQLGLNVHVITFVDLEFLKEGHINAGRK